MPENAPFAVTLWPGVIPLPAANRFEQYRLDGSETAILASGQTVPLDRKARVGEVYLRLGGLDLEDPEAILAFAHAQGTPNGVLVHNALTSTLAFTGRFAPNVDRNACARIRQNAQEEPFHDVTTLDSFRFTARCFRDLTACWSTVQSREPDPAPVELEELAIRGAEGKPLESPYPPALTALLILTDGLTALLQSVRPFVLPTPVPLEYQDPDLPPAPAGMAGIATEVPRKRDGTHLAELCALELFNHIAENATYRTCASETCQRPFVRQYGRSEHGQSKLSAIKYCTHACAQAQAQRDHRRRKKARQKTD